MIKRMLGITLIAMGISFAVSAQGDYERSIGIRIAPETYYDLFALSYKTFLSDAGAIEFNAGGGTKGYYYTNNRYHPFSLSVSGAYQHHFDIPVQGLKWFVGGGLTAYNAFSGEKRYRGFGFGFFPTGGADYKFPLIPLNLSVDYRPTIFFARPDYYDSFHASNFGISARYVIGGR
ncbi:MAG TPA: hypothetical protein PKV73_18255 [Agriterribacter sp.]|nr:hypothetical protein [Chitinophagaceae bacterium]HRP33849.1 hypothetical protein [Agriterribacter sp.]